MVTLEPETAHLQGLDAPGAGIGNAFRPVTVARLAKVRCILHNADTAGDRL